MLSVNDLVIEYTDGTRAVDSVRFAVQKGESVALIGANGAGKTSLMLALVGVLPLRSGDISVDGTVLEKKTLQYIRTRVGLVFQNPDDQLFMPSIYEDVSFGPRNFGCSEEEARKRSEDALERLEISHLAPRSPIKLSGGEKRLAAIAAALAMQPDYLLFDEPTAFLDPRARRNLKAVISGLPQGKLIATHDLQFAEECCSRVLLLCGGKLSADGGVSILRDASLLENAGL